MELCKEYKVEEIAFSLQVVEMPSASSFQPYLTKEIIQNNPQRPHQATTTINQAKKGQQNDALLFSCHITIF